MWSIGAGDVAMATALSRFSSTTPRKIGQLSARPVSRMRPPRALLESVASIGLGAHTLVGGAQALLALSWKNPLGVAVGVACIAAGKKIPALSTVAGVLAAVHILRCDPRACSGVLGRVSMPLSRDHKLVVKSQPRLSHRSWDRSVPEFPSSTFGPGAAAGSCRIAQSNARNNAGLQPPVVAGTVAEVEKRVVAWIEGEEWGRTGILDRKEVPRGVYLHSRHVSLVSCCAGEADTYGGTRWVLADTAAALGRSSGASRTTSSSASRTPAVGGAWSSTRGSFVWEAATSGSTLRGGRGCLRPSKLQASGSRLAQLRGDHTGHFNFFWQ